MQSSSLELLRCSLYYAKIPNISRIWKYFRPSLNHASITILKIHLSKMPDTLFHYKKRLMSE